MHKRKKCIFAAQKIMENHNRKREEFKIRLSGVELGKHSYSIDCDNTFFELAEIPELDAGLVKLCIDADISEKMVLLDFHFKGEVALPCHRCLDLVTIDLDYTEHLVVKLVPMISDEEFLEEDDLWVIDENTYELDLFHFVYESISLHLPMQIVHEDDEQGQSTCNPTFLKKLEELSQRDANEIDPRWEVLKNIKTD